MKNLQGMATQVGADVAGWIAPSSDVHQSDLDEEIHPLNMTTKTIVLVVLSIVGAMVVLFGSGMMANGAMGGISRMWIPSLLMLSIGVLLGWALFGQKK